MPVHLVATSTITFDAPADRVWKVITDTAAVKEFMFGTDLETDWTEGGPIAWARRVGRQTLRG
ncbi:activator of HSP90 ATPase 1 family protein [Arthrobacter sp. Hiyo4]|nr:activator of HSP90 ATPase 1 family protein [Arthrobacter sp. Hiyo4]